MRIRFTARVRAPTMATAGAMPWASVSVRLGIGLGRGLVPGLGLGLRLR